MYLGDDLIKAKFIRRVNRFFALVELEEREVGVHVANSGRLRELFVPGAPVWLKPATASGRKTAFDLAIVEAEGTLVSADARIPNALVAEAVAGGLFSEFGSWPTVTRESTFEDSRFDLMLEGEGGRLYVEVKSVTLRENGVGLFPDSPTTRGVKHLNTLVKAVNAGHKGAVLFAIQRADCHSFAVNEPADPALAAAFRHALECGVNAYAHSCFVSEQEVRLGPRVPIIAYDPIIPYEGICAVAERGRNE